MMMNRVGWKGDIVTMRWATWIIVFALGDSLNVVRVTMSNAMLTKTPKKSLSIHHIVGNRGYLTFVLRLYQH